LVGLLKDTLERELENIGIPKETRDFKAHITLARVRDLTETPNLDDLKGLDVGSTYIRDLVLFSSTLTPNGAIYSVVDRFPLGPQ
jgi:2'-5' RNA ligase